LGLNAVVAATDRCYHWERLRSADAMTMRCLDLTYLLWLS
jgi:hypothetical protein